MRTSLLAAIATERCSAIDQVVGTLTAKWTSQLSLATIKNAEQETATDCKPIFHNDLRQNPAEIKCGKWAILDSKSRQTAGKSERFYSGLTTGLKIEKFNEQPWRLHSFRWYLGSNKWVMWYGYINWRCDTSRLHDLWQVQYWIRQRRTIPESTLMI